MNKLKKLLPTTKTKTSLFAFTLVLIAALLTYFGGIYYLVEQKDILSESRVQLEKEEKKNSELEQVKEVFTSSAKEVEVSNLYVLGENDNFVYLERLDQLAGKNEVQVDLNVSSEVESATENSAALNWLRINVSVVGDWSQTFAFLQDVVSSPTLTKIENLTLARVDASSGDAISIDDFEEEGFPGEGSSESEVETADNRWQTSFQLLVLQENEESANNNSE